MNIFEDNINLILYVMSLSAYDQVLFEDISVKCYDETFSVFDDLTQNRIFYNTDFVVFFNKVDVFDVKIGAVPFTTCVPSFNTEWAHNRKKIVGYVRTKFETLFKQNTEAMHRKPTKSIFRNTNSPPPQRDVFFHVTCATDTRRMQQVINDVQFGIVRRQLQMAHLA
ncbi:hypothetical protein RFI_19234 [Reticulomyxa filosa]|uniref:Uncharacterized protein n=1 Tax=Reticulomyxa filosa TaxID=46433 RepID=X6MWN8_RETFI|nr:hypothetical protein RFI_19234 [Reticulomyxa filosa]|eukprot:ETO18061.1 hypothetical protein RFI_19234 [Reticulomyxa filosa]